MKSRRLALLFIAVCGIAWAGAPNAATSDAPTSDETEPSLSPIVAGEKADATKVTAFAPLAYFNQNCARCHGENGVFYGENFAKDQTDAHLRETIEEMAEGPGQAPLTPAELDAVAAWHRALRDKKPFVTIVNSAKIETGVQLSGEISPGATLEVNGENVEVKGSQWTARVAPGAVKLRATKGDATTELDANTASN